MNKDEALKLALVALEACIDYIPDNTVQGEKDADLAEDAITAIKAALEAKDEPVACVIDGDLYFHHEIDWEDLAYQGHGIELLYTTPPQRKPLTDEEILTYRHMIDWTAEWSYINFARAIEAAHGIKENT
jgi:hypothetical protein